jgi:Niemann-Pick C1 protein
VQNDKYFNQGTSFTVYTRETDYFAAQPQLRALDTFLSSSPLVDSTEPVKNWHKSFTAWAATTVEPAAGADNMWAGTFTPSTGIFTTSTAFFGALKTFFQSGDGARYRSSIEWKDTRCQDNDSWNLCNALQGLSATRMTATIASDKLQGGQSRYDTMEELRAELDAKGGALNAFPYAREFSNWEEVGIIGTEMVRNLVICGVVVFVVVFTMIPRPRVAVWVVLCILFSIVDVVGMLYWWDVTVNSISTIYILISIGLAVDYSAHIAHMFKESKGSAQERACAALGRIGPCVLNAIISTFLAVVMFGFSASYIFRVMFKAFFLVVVVAGMHGLWLLPVLLTLGGGDNGVAEEDPLQITADGEGTTDNPLKSAEKEEEEEEEKEQGSD